VDRTDFQFSIRSAFLFTTTSAVAFASGRAFGVEFFLAIVCLAASGIGLACVCFVIAKSRQLPAAMILGVFSGAVVSELIGWSLPHAIVFVFGVAFMIYFLAIWFGADVAIQLDSPVLGIPLVLLFFFLVWAAHLSPGAQARPITMTMSALLAAPFVASTVFKTIGLD
jgi:hypothetical protein